MYIKKMQKIEHLTMASCPTDRTLTNYGCIVTELLKDSCPEDSTKTPQDIIDPVTGKNLPSKYVCSREDVKEATKPTCPLENGEEGKYSLSFIPKNEFKPNLKDDVNIYTCSTMAVENASTDGKDPTYTCPNDKILVGRRCY